jgi:hypothetical protein
MVLFSAGCTVKLGGRERPLLRHDPIEGEVELAAELDKSTGKSGEERKSETRVFQERLNLRTKGDLYHPNMFLYAASLGLGLDQQSIDSDDGSESIIDSIAEYSFSGTLLQRKPYPFSFGFSKNENLASRHFLGPLKSKSESQYFALRLNNRKFPMSFRYNEYEIDQNPVSDFSTASDSFFRTEKTFRYNIRHDLSRYSRFNFNFDRRQSFQENTSGRNLTDTDNYDLSHEWRLGDDQEIAINSKVFLRDQTLPVDFQTFRWNEDLTYRHSDNFQTNYIFSSTDSKREGLEEQSVSYGTGFTHQLYDSLRTSGNVYGYNTVRQGESEEDQRGGSLSVNYTKDNRWGNIFADYRLDLYCLDRTGDGGTGIVDNEPHVVPSGSTRPQITLNEVNVDETSIIVENGGGDVFNEGPDYTVSTVGGETRLTLETIGASPKFVPGETIYVDYTYFVESERTEKTVNQVFAIGQNFDNGLSVYFEHERQNEDLTSSDAAASPDDFTNNMISADYTKGGLFLGSRYSMRDSTQQESESMSFNARYSWDIDATKKLSVWGGKQLQDYGEPQLRNVDSMSLGSEFYWRLSNKYSFTADMEYVEENDTLFGDTSGFDFNSELEYKYRQFSFLSGLDYTTLTRMSSTTDTLFIYMRIRREF